MRSASATARISDAGFPPARWQHAEPRTSAAFPVTDRRFRRSVLDRLALQLVHEPDRGRRQRCVRIRVRRPSGRAGRVGDHDRTGLATRSAAALQACAHNRASAAARRRGAARRAGHRARRRRGDDARPRWQAPRRQPQLRSSATCDRSADPRLGNRPALPEAADSRGRARGGEHHGSGTRLARATPCRPAPPCRRGRGGPDRYRDCSDARERPTR